jgi:hypothetical protein
MKKIIFILLGLLLANFGFSQCACCSAPTGFSGGDVSPANYALGKKQMMVELYDDSRFFNGISHQHNIDHNQSSATPINYMAIGILGFRYGISSKLNLSLQLPYIYIGAQTQSSNAFGDAVSLLNYTIFNKRNVILAAQLGMEWPTGQSLQVNGLNSVTTGSGSYDPLMGMNISKIMNKGVLRASTFFKYTTKGFNDTYYGNFWANQLMYQHYLVSPAMVCGKDSSSATSFGCSMIAQLSGEYLQAQFREHGAVENTGSYSVLAAIGAGFNFKGFSIPILFTIPLYQDLNGEQNITQFRLRIGLTKTFN